MAAQGNGKTSVIIPAIIGIILAGLSAFGIVSAVGASQGDSNPQLVSQYGEQ